VSAIREKLKARADAGLTSYRDVVRRLADQKSVRPDEALVALEAAGKTAVDLEKDVQAVLSRRALAAKAERLPAIERERQEVEVQAKAAAAAFAVIEAKHETAMDTFRGRLYQLRASETDAATARSMLVSSCPDVEWSAQHRVALAKVSKLGGRRDELARETNHLAMFELAPPTAAQSPGAREVARGDQEVAAERHRADVARLAALRRDLRDVEQALAGAQADLARLEEKAVSL